MASVLFRRPNTRLFLWYRNVVVCRVLLACRLVWSVLSAVVVFQASWNPCPLKSVCSIILFKLSCMSYTPTFLPLLSFKAWSVSECSMCEGQPWLASEASSVLNTVRSVTCDWYYLWLPQLLLFINLTCVIINQVKTYVQPPSCVRLITWACANEFYSPFPLYLLFLHMVLLVSFRP